MGRTKTKIRRTLPRRKDLGPVSKSRDCLMALKPENEISRSQKYRRRRLGITEDRRGYHANHASGPSHYRWRSGGAGNQTPQQQKNRGGKTGHKRERGRKPQNPSFCPSPLGGGGGKPKPDPPHASDS